MKYAALPLTLAFSACASVPPAGVPVTGAWGGPHIGLTLGESGGRIEYDCAVGTIGSVVPGRDGSFAAAGSHTPDWGGPAIEGQVLPTYRASFTGSVRGDRMTLQGEVENGAAFGPFTLRRGAEPGIFRCL